jgi:hypothetical protein
MTASIIDLLQGLIDESLAAWRVAGHVRREADGTIAVTANAICIRVMHDQTTPPFRWTVTAGERARRATSIAGVLRNLRAAVDPDYRPLRLRIAPLPPAASAPPRQA